MLHECFHVGQHDVLCLADGLSADQEHFTRACVGRRDLSLFLLQVTGDGRRSMLGIFFPSREVLQFNTRPEPEASKNPYQSPVTKRS